MKHDFSLRVTRGINKYLDKKKKEIEYKKDKASKEKAEYNLKGDKLAVIRESLYIQNFLGTKERVVNKTLKITKEIEHTLEMF